MSDKKYLKKIRHVVFFSSKKKDDIESIIKGLEMLGKIPDVEYFEVSKNLKKDSFSNEVDIIVYAEFLTKEALARYHSHPIYQKCIDIVRPIRDLRIAADF